MYEYLDRRYAVALYKIAKEKNKVSQVISELKEVCEIIEGNEQLKEVLEHPQISSGEKKDFINKIFKGNIDEDLLNFMNLLIEKDRIANLRSKFNQLEAIMLEENNTVKATVKTCVKLSKEQCTKLIEKLEKQYNKKIILEEVIDTSIIGGVYLKIGNEVIDGTLAYQYDEIKDLMVNKR